jgi:CMP-N-acetylneuraminic acid synthetase
LGGRPLIAYSIEAARGSRLLDAILVSTDDRDIAQAARDAGAPVPFLRPPELATDEIPIWPVALHATRQWEALSGRPVRATVLLQATSPLRTAEDIDGCIRRFWDRAADVCASVFRSHDSPLFQYGRARCRNS